jgi:hypothetical protein
LKAKTDGKDSKVSLKDKEIKLCNELNLKFREYLLIKEILVRESML